MHSNLAHIALAGRYFVPHYAVPQPHRIVAAGDELHADVRDDAKTLAQLDAGTTFDVLDITSRTAWDQVGSTSNDIDGLVSYIALTQLEEAT